MRTTLNIDDSVLEAVKEIARRRRTSTGAVASALIQQALNQAPHDSHGFHPFQARTQDPRITDGQVDRLRDDLGI
jgi:hypothetical protein